jgi:hypothetical protein
MPNDQASSAAKKSAKTRKLRETATKAGHTVRVRTIAKKLEQVKEQLSVIQKSLKDLEQIKGTIRGRRSPRRAG